MGRDIRHAAGSQSFTDLLLHPNRIFGQSTAHGRRRAEADVAALTAGEARKVSAFSREGRRFRQGWLILDPEAPSPWVWRRFYIVRRRGEAVALVAPVGVEAGPVTGKGSHTIDKSLFRLLTVRAADRTWELAVPALDVPLVRAALLGDGTGPSPH